MQLKYSAKWRGNFRVLKGLDWLVQTTKPPIKPPTIKTELQNGQNKQGTKKNCNQFLKCNPQKYNFKGANTSKNANKNKYIGKLILKPSNGRKLVFYTLIGVHPKKRF